MPNQEFPTGRKGPPNFIFIIADELRADAVHCLDGRDVRTPNIDALAEQGSLFSRCFVQNPVCGPSRCSLLTGWYPHVSGHRTLDHLLKPGEPNLAKYLKQAGYHVEWHGRNDALSEAAFEQSVSYRSTDSGTPPFPRNPWPRNPFPLDHPSRKSFYFGPRDREAAQTDYDAAQFRGAIRFLESGPKEPFFLYVGPIFPHPPYSVEEPYFSMYDRDRIPAPLPSKLDDKPRFMREIHRAYGLDRLSDQDYREIVATYWGMVTRTDDLIGNLMRVLDASPHANNTHVIFTADHGDYLGDYGLTEKWPTSFQDCVLRVPLIFRLAGLKGAARIEALAEHIDLFPTILELAGVEAKHSHYGRSLMPLIRGETDQHRHQVFAEGGFLPEETHAIEAVYPERNVYHDKTRIQNEEPMTVAKAAMIRNEKWKYVMRLSGEDELYDLETDPGELTNRIGDPGLAAVVQEMKARLLEWYVRTGDVVPFESDPRF